MNTINIAGRKIGAGYPPFIIAEMSGNHNHSLERALKIVEAAAKSGAHALKIQTYTADTMTLNVEEGEFLITDKNSPWYGRSLYSLYDEAHTPWEWHKPIFDRARELGLIAFSSPFDETAIDFLEELDTPIYKIASFENIDIPLIQKVAQTGKPMIISTGMASVGEIHEAVFAARESGCVDIMLLKCTSSYPASPDTTNILTIPHMRELFNCDVGLSDHTLGIGVSIASIALGATAIEKHFTLRREDGGVDSAFSLEFAEMRALVEETKRAWKSLGQVRYGPVQTEKYSTSFRRSLYIVRNLRKGDILTPENLKSIRPGLGLAPKYYETLLGMRVRQDVKRASPTRWDLFS